MAKKRVVDPVDELLVSAGFGPLIEEVAPKTYDLPSLEYKITFTYLEDFQLNTDQRKEEVMLAKDMNLAKYAAVRGLSQGLDILRDDEILIVPANRVLQAKIGRNDGK